MKSKTLGIILVTIGIVMLIYTGFSYVTTEKVVDLGPIQINKEKNHFVQWPPIVGVVLLIGGVLVIAFDKKISK
jgi:uncharacterized membrane protein YidH (DUF202 family)